MGGSVESGFQFLAYKVDTLQLDVAKDFRSLSFTGTLGPEQVELSVAFRLPLRLTAERAYVGGLELVVSVFWSADHSESNRIAQAKAGIAGLFKVVGPDITPEMEKSLATIQIPAILMPYGRTALTSVFATSGLPGIILPLINVQELARNAGDQIQIREMQPPTEEAAPALR